MKISEVRELSSEQLNDKIYSLKEELFNLRRKKLLVNSKIYQKSKELEKISHVSTQF